MVTVTNLLAGLVVWRQGAGVSAHHDAPAAQEVRALPTQGGRPSYLPTLRMVVRRCA